jgi:tRNA nucleotidyltransferase (CCA-adding enzyme)
MCKELPITSSTQLFLELFLSSHFDKAIESKLPLEVLLIHFADMNIWMDWYIPRQERIQKLHTRFMRNKNYTKLEADHAVQQLLQAWQYTCEVLHSLWRDDSLMTAEFIDSEAEWLRAFKII